MIILMRAGRRHANFRKFLAGRRTRDRWVGGWTRVAPFLRGRRPIAGGRIDAFFRIFSAATAREPERGADRLAPADAARRDDPPAERRDLFMAAARPARAPKC